MDQRISGETFSDTLPENKFHLEPDFVPLDQSIIWTFNDLFWKHLKLWEETYHEGFEDLQPDGVSRTNRPDFVQTSAQRFLHLVERLEKEKRLPPEIVVLEQGPGSGQYAKLFLEYVGINGNRELVKRVKYVLSDTSEEVLDKVKQVVSDRAGKAGSASKVEFYLQKNPYDLPQKYKDKILFARHSNVFDQLPSRLVRLAGQKVREIEVRAVVDERYKNIREKNLEKVILENPKLWKELWQAVKLETKEVEINESFPYKELVAKVLERLPGAQEIMWSTGALKNIEGLVELIDWQKDGYLELSGLCLSKPEQFLKDRKPKKYDGALAVPVNGLLIQEYVKTKSKTAKIKSIYGINQKLTIMNQNLKTLLESGEWITFAEIAAKKDQSKEQIQDKARKLLDLGIDCLVFSDQPHASDEFYSITELVENQLFENLPQDIILPVLATRKRTWEQIDEVVTALRKTNIPNLFPVSGDPNIGEGSGITSLDLVPKIADKFFCGGVANPTVSDIPRCLEKIENGVQFLIVQASYDETGWYEWVEEIRKQEIHKKVPIVQVIIPIVSSKTLGMLSKLGGVRVAKNIFDKFSGLEDVAVRIKGLEMAKEAVKDYKEAGILSGVYIFSRSTEVITQLLN